MPGRQTSLGRQGRVPCLLCVSQRRALPGSADTVGVGSTHRTALRTWTPWFQNRDRSVAPRHGLQLLLNAATLCASVEQCHEKESVTTPRSRWKSEGRALGGCEKRTLRWGGRSAGLAESGTPAPSLEAAYYETAKCGGSRGCTDPRRMQLSLHPTCSNPCRCRSWRSSLSALEAWLGSGQSIYQAVDRRRDRWGPFTWTKACAEHYT